VSDEGKREDQEVESGAPEYLSPDDPSLLLGDVPRLNKKAIKAIFAGLGGIMMAALMFAMVPPAARQQEEEEDALAFRRQVPEELMITEEDYYRREEEPEEVPMPLVEEEGGGETEYREYDRRPPPETVTTRETEPQTQPPPVSGRSGIDPMAQNQEAQERQADILYRVALPSQSQMGGAEMTAQDRIALAQAEAIGTQAELEAMTEYQKQNQQRENQMWLDSLGTDYSAYVDQQANFPVDALREVKAGTMIPIVMQTGINSDLPGDISAVVVANVFDTITGTQLLIPRGSRVVGSYDSSIAFGQNRVLIGWERIIRPDGVSMIIEGMQGTDLSGTSGLAGRVDRHLDDIAAAIAISTTFDLAANSVTALLASTPYLSGLGEMLDSDGQTELARTVAEQYVQKVLNRQPTITVQAGTRGSIFVSKDLILPPFDDWRGGLP
jgi:type IV secretory pathway VirB10-like protein